MWGHRRDETQAIWRATTKRKLCSEPELSTRVSYILRAAMAEHVPAMTPPDRNISSLRAYAKRARSLFWEARFLAYDVHCDSRFRRSLTASTFPRWRSSVPS
jgi:hypothetical protein